MIRGRSCRGGPDYVSGGLSCNVSTCKRYTPPRPKGTALKLHYLATAADVQTWHGATPVHEAACGTRSGRRNNEALLATSRRDAVTCAKCRAVLTELSAHEMAEGMTILVNGSEAVTVAEVTRRDSASVANGVVFFTGTNGHHYGLKRHDRLRFA